VADFEAWLVFLILVANVVGELQRKRTLAASRGFLAAARLSCCLIDTAAHSDYCSYAPVKYSHSLTYSLTPNSSLSQILSS